MPGESVRKQPRESETSSRRPRESEIVRSKRPRESEFVRNGPPDPVRAREPTAAAGPTPGTLAPPAELSGHSEPANQKSARGAAARKRALRIQVPEERFPGMAGNPALRRAVMLHMAMQAGLPRADAVAYVEERLGPRVGSRRVAARRGKAQPEELPKPGAPVRRRKPAAA